MSTEFCGQKFVDGNCGLLTEVKVSSPPLPITFDVSAISECKEYSVVNFNIKSEFRNV